TTVRQNDIRSFPDEGKEKVYDQIHSLFHQGKEARIREHKSGFPAVTVDCEDIHILTDSISLEQWWAKQKQKERG
ncbi:unnamed protein product, partial [marine sediment metagenome]